MTSLNRRLHGPWANPLASGGLIAVAAVLSFVAGVNPFSGGHVDAPTGVTGLLLASDAFMVDRKSVV